MNDLIFTFPWPETGLLLVHPRWIRISKPGGLHHVRPTTRFGIERGLAALEARRDAARRATGPAGV